MLYAWVVMGKGLKFNDVRGGKSVCKASQGYIQQTLVSC